MFQAIERQTIVHNFFWENNILLSSSLRVAFLHLPQQILTVSVNRPLPAYAI
jgi:hypothetical protein